jgi:hypothetical protein
MSAFLTSLKRAMTAPETPFTSEFKALCMTRSSYDHRQLFIINQKLTHRRRTLGGKSWSPLVSHCNRIGHIFSEGFSYHISFYLDIYCFSIISSVLYTAKSSFEIVKTLICIFVAFSLHSYIFLLYHLFLRVCEILSD